jgi:transposase
MDALIPKHHLLRKIDQHVSFGFIKALTAKKYCPSNGRPSIDPEIFFRLMIISYLYNINSDRQLCEELHYNLAYRWFCKLSLGDKVPDHSSLTRIRDRLGLDLFKAFFDEIIQQCQERNLIKGKRIMTDGTLIEANASLDLLRLKENRADQSNYLPISNKAPETIKKVYLPLSNQTHLSTTDPEATLAKKEGAARKLRYKAHLSIDADSRVILLIQATTGACHESQIYIKHIKTLSRERNLTLEETIADRAYGTGEILQAITQHKITPYIPLLTDRAGTTLAQSTEGFIFEEENNRYQCPAGLYLLPYTKTTDRRIMYRSRSKDCRSCSLAAQCSAYRMKHSHMRYIRRNKHQALFEETLARMKTQIFNERLIERFWKIEGIIGEAKNLHGLGRAKYRGLQKMQIQAYLSASILNVKRLIQAFLLIFFCSLIAQRQLKFRYCSKLRARSSLKYTFSTG